MEKRVGLKLKERFYELVKIEERFDCENPDNNFIKISLKTLFPDQNGNAKKIDDREYTLHPSKTHLKIKTKGHVKLCDGNNPPFYEYYDDIYPNIGYDNFKGSLLLVHQCLYDCGFLSRPYCKNPMEKCDFLSLEIEYDDPFWFGIIFFKNKEEVHKILTNKTISEYYIHSTKFGNIIISIKKLKPAWEKMEVQKDRKVLHHYTSHDQFSLKNIF